jgi:hypothetical protein
MEYLEKIEGLVYTADKFNEMSFRMVLEGLVAKGGEEAEYLLVRYITSPELDTTTRINIIRVVGYIQSPHFLVPLNKIIDTEENIYLKKEAVISVSKYNDRRAYNILNRALSNIKNTLLLETINTEIAKIKKNNPLFGLLPRFLEGDKNLKNFSTTLGILKRILTPNDAAMFVNYLTCGRETIENGAFEILCFTGNIDQKKAVLNFFQDRFSQTQCLNDDVCEDLFLLTLKLKHYYGRFPELIDEELDNLGTQLYLIHDARIRGLFISIICSSQQPPAIAFMRQVYDSDPELRDSIVYEYSGNGAAVDFLFEQYELLNAADNKNHENKNGKSRIANTLKERLITSLLNSRKGLDYFFLQFPSLDEEEQTVIVNHLPYGGEHDVSAFVIMILQTENYELKEVILNKAKEHSEFSVKDVLFDPAREKEFFFIERQYLETITALFPISTTKMLLEKIIFDDLSANKTKKYLQVVSEILPSGLTLNFKDRHFVHSLLTKIVLLNNTELNCLFLSLYRHIKTLDLETYKNLNESLGVFTTLKEKKVSVQEGDELRRARKNFNEVFFEIRRITEAMKLMERMFLRPELDFDQLEDFLNKNGITVALHIDRLRQLIEKSLAEAGQESMRHWVLLLRRFPVIGFRLKTSIKQLAETSQPQFKTALNRLADSLPQQMPKIIIRVTDNHITAVLREQCREILPDFPVTLAKKELNEDDVLICDQEYLKDFILTGTLPSQKLYLLLDKRSDFSSFKSYNPRPLLKPFSAYRIIKEILKELYI